MFAGGGEFQRELRRRVAEQLTPERVRRGRWFVSIKGAVIGLWAVGSYVGLVFLADAWWQAVPLALSLALATAGIAFAVGHDANHGAFSKGRRWNRVLGFSFDLIGASSYVWRTKHNMAHHSFTNVVGADDDIDQMPFARLTPDQPRKWFHRWQHIYVWPLYGLFTFRTHLGGDVAQAFSGKIGDITRLPRPKGSELAWFIAGKALFWTWAVIIPLFFHAWWQVAIMFAVVSWTLGFTLATVFQLAHAVDEADFTTIERLQELSEAPGWAEHQVETTVDFAPRNKVLAWYLGGLNFQIEHHLFPKVCHVHYPRLAKVVAETCDTYGVRHTTQPTLRAALASHGRWLREMGRPDVTVGAARG
jgi:linoleoyl-CoA desaturase